MFIFQYGTRASGYRCKDQKILDGMHGYVLVYGSKRRLTSQNLTVSHALLQTHANCLHFSISLSKWRFSYNRFWSPRLAWSISTLACAVAVRWELAVAFVARLNAFKRAMSTPALIWSVDRSSFLWSWVIRLRKLSNVDEESVMAAVKQWPMLAQKWLLWLMKALRICNHRGIEPTPILHICPACSVLSGDIVFT